jgi:hypothetical protein
MLIGGIIAIIVIIALVGVFVVHSGSGGKQAGAPNNGAQATVTVNASVSSGGKGNASTTTASTSIASKTVTTPQSSINLTLANETAALSYLDKGCDLNGVTQITQSSTNLPGESVTYTLSNSNVTAMTTTSPGHPSSTTNFTGALKGDGNLAIEVLCAASGASSEWESIAQASGGNTDGKWFTYAYNGTTGYFNINASNSNYVSLEERIPGVTINGTKFNDLFVTKLVLLKRTDSLAATAGFYIPGTNPMTSESFQTLMSGANATASEQISYNMAIAEDPGLAKYYSSFSAYEAAMSGGTGASSGIGWENYTYTFK